MDLENPYPKNRRFVPPCCPLSDCPSRTTEPAPFLWQRKGHFWRACDGRTIQRFRCLACGRSFSVQSFRVDCGLRKPQLTGPLFDSFVSKTTQRQIARNLECTRKTVSRRLRRLSAHSLDFQTAVLERARERGGLVGKFQLDELETYEHSRRLKPVTMPVLIESASRFVIHARVAPLPSRGRLKGHAQVRKAEIEATEGKRRSGSRAAVFACFEVLKWVVKADHSVVISTDQKSSYSTVVRELFGGHGLSHLRFPGSAERSVENPLWPINHTLAMLRDGISRLVRRTWAASKQRRWLESHAWIWISYRNYIRGFTNRLKGTTSGQKLGVVSKRFTKVEFFTWRVVPSPSRPSEGGHHPGKDRGMVSAPPPAP